jgi:hypothetical protein
MSVRPFDNESQFRDWEANNCDHCVKAWKDGLFDKNGHAVYACDIDAALTVAYCGDGMITSDIAKRMGFNDMGHWYCWSCKEFVEARDWRSLQ